MTMVATYTTINTHVRILFPFPILFIIARNEWPGSYSMPLFFVLFPLLCFISLLVALCSFPVALSYRFKSFICYFRIFSSFHTHSHLLSLSFSLFYFHVPFPSVYLWILCSCLFYAFQKDNFGTQLAMIILNIHLHRFKQSDTFQLIAPCCCSVHVCLNILFLLLYPLFVCECVCACVFLIANLLLLVIFPLTSNHLWIDWFSPTLVSKYVRRNLWCMTLNCRVISFVFH